MRPRPPFDIDEPILRYEPAPELAQWARATFIEEGGPAYNPEHAHLEHAHIGFAWTNKTNARAGRRVIGLCELMPPTAMGAWSRARVEQQLVSWFGDMPDFLITIDAVAAEVMDDVSFMALVEHELMHAAQARDEFGAPKFTKLGRPVFALRGHDVEEFVSIVRRYGAEAAGVAQLVEAAQEAPTIGRAAVARACGNCLRLVG